MINWLTEGARGLSPAYFALVMATGIVSIALDRAELRTIAAVLLWLNAAQISGVTGPRVTCGAPYDCDSTAALPAGVTESQPPRFKFPILVG